jgi:hypothetical protein
VVLCCGQFSAFRIQKGRQAVNDRWANHVDESAEKGDALLSVTDQGYQPVYSDVMYRQPCLREQIKVKSSQTNSIRQCRNGSRSIFIKMSEEDEVRICKERYQTRLSSAVFQIRQQSNSKSQAPREAVRWSRETYETLYIRSIQSNSL